MAAEPSSAASVPDHDDVPSASVTSDHDDVIKYCLKSSYLPRNFLLSCEKKELDEILKEKIEGNLQKDIDKEMKKRTDEVAMYEPKENHDDLKTQVKIFNDAVHKSIELNALELAIVDTREFSRLRRIKQLGGTSYVYPGAVHTRFEHSIGVCHLAGKFIDRLRKKQKNYKRAQNEENDKAICFSDKEEQCIRIAALCHDLGHGPYSHMFESLRKKIMCPKKVITHEGLSILLLKKILATNMKVLDRFVAFGLTWKHVWMIEFMIHPGENEEKVRTKRSFLYEIVANKDSGMDVDKWDYYARDCHYLGITNEFDCGRSMELSNIVLCKKNKSKEATKKKKTESEVGANGVDKTDNAVEVVEAAQTESEDSYHIGFRLKEVDNIYRMFRTRTVLYQKACVHPVVDAIEIMISDALYEIRDEKILYIEGTKKSLKEILQQFTEGPLEKMRKLEEYVALTDHILSIIENCPEENPKINKAKAILTKLEQRQLYWCCKEIVIPCKDYEIQDYEKKVKLLRGEVLSEGAIGGHFSECTFEIEVPKVAYSSETAANPVEKIYFYKEEEYLPEACPQDPDKELVSRLHTPQSFLEYRVRLYCKSKKTKERTATEELDRCDAYLRKRITETSQ